MSILKKVKAAKAEKPKPRYRVRNGKIVMRMAATLAAPKPASNIREVRRKLPREMGQHVIGGTCPHCLGSGRYGWHLQDRREKCFRCHGKGHLDKRDIQFLAGRQGGAGPICHVASAG